MTTLAPALTLPPPYRWLDHVDGLSRILVEARHLLGVVETPGKASNPEILRWAKEVGLERTYPSDDVAWCGLFAAVAAQRAGWEVPGGPLWARNWANFGRSVPEGEEALGDVLVFSRPGGGGHVGFYIGEDAESFHVLGGNQSDKVCIIRIDKERLIAARRPKWRLSQPSGVVKRRLQSNGVKSRNEA